MYNYACKIEWKGREARAEWERYEEDSKGCSLEWDQIVLGAKEFAGKVQNILKNGLEKFEDIVETALDSVIAQYEFSRAQTFEVISILTKVWVYGEELRVWSNVREGVEPSFSGLYFR